MKKLLYLLTLVLVCNSLPGRAQSPTDPALGFNVFLLNGGTLVTNETEGPVAMGGDMTLSGSSYQISNNYTGTYQVNGVPVTLLVGGKINYTSGNGVTINSNGYVKIGNSTGSYVWYTDPNGAYSPIRITPGSSYNGSPRINLQANAQQLNVSATNNPVFQSGLVDFTAAFNTMKSSSTCMGGLTDNATITNANGVVLPLPHTNLPNQIKITLNTGLNILNLSGADINSVQSITYNNTPDATHILLINVNYTGTFAWSVWNSAGNIGLTSSSYVMYNFSNTTNLNIQGNGAIEGTVFAPYAEITKTANQSNIEGQIIAKSYYHSGGENHYAVFAPSITGCSSTPTVPAFAANTSSQCLTGNSFSFTNTSTGGGTLTYSWNFGDNTTSTATSPTKTYTTAGTYTVKLKVTGSGGVDSITHTVTVNAMVTPSATISANPSGAVCSGTPITFTASNITNGGGAPAYLWKKNGVSVSNTTLTYTTNAPANNDVITFQLTSSADCASPTAVTSNALTLTVNSTVTPALTISPNPSGAVCTGTPVTYSIGTITNGGTAPTFQWKKNNVNVGTGTSYVSSAPANGDEVKCVLTSNAPCVSTATATSNVIVMTVNSNVTPSLTITANPSGNICSGTPVVFTAGSITNGGAVPTYVWKKNGVSTGITTTTYTLSSPSNNDIITCVMTSNASCLISNPATSNAITMTVNASVTPSLAITANPAGQICSGTPVTYTAGSIANGGATPTYQWKKNNNNVGTGLTYTDNALVNGDEIKCVMTSNASCTISNTATSNVVVANVGSASAQPGAFSTSSPITYQGQVAVTYTVPNVSGTTYTWVYSGTNVTVIGTGNSVVLDFGINATGGNLNVTATTPGSCGPSAPQTIAITVKPYITWNCQTGINWNTASNWDCGFVPYGTISVLIPANTCSPKLDGVTGNCRDLMIDSNAHITIDTTAALNAKGNIRLDGDALGKGYLKLTGTTNQPITGNGRVDNLQLDNPQGATINNGDTIHIGKRYKPSNGTLTTNGGFELLSDSTWTATILSNTSSCNYISGEVICDKYIHGSRRAFRFLGHPYSQAIPLSQLTPFIDITGQNGSASGFTTTPSNNPSSFWYNTLTGNGSSSNDSTGWIPFTNTDGQGANAWNPYQGMRVLVRGALGEGFGCCPYDPSPVTIKTHGPVNMCDISVACQTNANAGYNLISNPYACNIDLSQSNRGNSVGANFSVWDPNQGTGGAYVAQPFGFSYILPAYSSFVTTCSAATNNTITFHESDKTGSTSTGNLFKTTSGFGNDVVQLRVLSNNDSLSWDRLLLFFDGTAVSVTDPMDNIKLSNPSLDFYTFSADSKHLSVDVRPYANGEAVQLGLRANVQQAYSIRVDDYNVAAGAQLYLHDKYLNQTETLVDGMHYNFDITSDPASQGDNRFEINVTATTTGISPVANPTGIIMNMAPNPASDNLNVTFQSPESTKTTITIANLMGQQVYSRALGDQKSANVNISLKDLAPGVYMVNLTCGYRTITKRLIKN